MEYNSQERESLREFKRAEMFSDALNSLEKWRGLVISKFDSVGDWDSKEPGYNIGNNYSKDKELYNSYERMSIRGILTQKGIESISTKDLMHLDPPIREIVREKSEDVKLLNDLAFFFLNNSNEFISFCDSTLKNKLDKDNYTEDFMSKLNEFYYRSSNFTNTFIKFYMTYISKIKYVSETKELTESFTGGTELRTILQSKHFYLKGGLVKRLEDTNHSVFSVDLKQDIHKVLEYMYLKGSEENPFRVKIGGMIYYRDLINRFTTYSRFEDNIRSQFIENILNKTGSLLIDHYDDKVFFAYAGDVDRLVKQLDFRVYGVKFSQKIKLEVVGG